jgi:hypothetical protein
MNLSSRVQFIFLSIEQKKAAGIVEKGSQAVIVCSEADTHMVTVSLLHRYRSHG